MGLKWRRENENDIGRSRWKGRKWELGFRVRRGCMGCEGGGK